jgi:hypothetical protein
MLKRRAGIVCCDVAAAQLSNHLTLLTSYSAF